LILPLGPQSPQAKGCWLSRNPAFIPFYLLCVFISLFLLLASPPSPGMFYSWFLIRDFLVPLGSCFFYLPTFTILFIFLFCRYLQSTRFFLFSPFYFSFNCCSAPAVFIPLVLFLSFLSSLTVCCFYGPPLQFCCESLPASASRLSA